MYTESTLTLSEDTKIRVHGLEAGTALYDHDTERLPHPYAPAVSKPFHILDSWKENGYDFSSQIVGQPADVQFSCIFGRDGAVDADWTTNTLSVDGAIAVESVMDNVGCAQSAGFRALSVQQHSVQWVHLNQFNVLAVALVVIALVLGVRSRYLRQKQCAESTESLPLLNHN